MPICLSYENYCRNSDLEEENYEFKREVNSSLQMEECQRKLYNITYFKLYSGNLHSI